MKKAFVAFSVLIITLLCSISVFAIDTDDSGMWEYQTYGTGVVLTNYKGTQTDVYVPNKITKGENEYSVLKLGDNLFKDNTALNSATLGEGIKEIGASAFEGATGLVCIVTPESLTTIGDKAFYGCTAFNSIVLNETVASIPNGVFSGCQNVKIYGVDNGEIEAYANENNIAFIPISEEATPEIVVKSGVEYYIMNGEAMVVSFDKSVTNIVIASTVNNFPVTQLKNTFSDCTSLKSITLPGSLKHIESKAFHECTSLQSVTIGNGVTSIGSFAFYGCTSLTKVSIPDSVTTISQNAFHNCSSLTSISIKGNLSHIGSDAFAFCTKLATVTLPNRMETIGDHAFAGCTSLRSINIGNSITLIDDYAFYSCRSLTSITIPQGIETIGNSAFEYCTGLTRVTIGNGVKKIGDKAFQNCSSLTSITFPDSLTSIGSNAFSFCRELTSVTMGNGVTAIGEHAFFSCDNIEYVYINDISAWCNIDFASHASNPLNGAKNLSLNNTTVTDLVIPEDVTEVKKYTFPFCDFLTSITVPDNVTVIGDYAFYNSKNLTQVTIGNGPTSIGDHAFKGCSSITKLTIGNGITRIGDSAFFECVGIDTIVIPKSVNEMFKTSFPSDTMLGIYENSYAHTFAENNNLLYYITVNGEMFQPYIVGGVGYTFRGGVAVAVVFDNSTTNVVIPSTVNGYPVTELNGTFRNCVNLKSVSLPDGLKKVGAYAFYNCRGLTSVTIPDSVTFIGERAFCECRGITSINIPENVTHIGERAFYYCVGISNITIPKGITSIGDYMFYYCTGLTNITIPDSVTSIGDYAFYYCSRLTVPISNNITSIGEYAFSYSRVSKDLIIPDNLDTIGNYAFFNCPTLESVTISNGVVSIGNNAFSACTQLCSVIIGDGVTDIGDKAFSGCSNLYNVVIGDSVTSIGSNAFYNCRNLQSVVIPSSVTTLYTDTFPTALIICVYKDSYAHAFAIENDLPFYITTNGEIAEVYEADGVIYYISHDKEAIVFSAERYIESVTIPETVENYPVTEIKPYSFENCLSLESIVIGDNVKIIGDYAFYRCGSLTEVFIGDGVTDIGDYAFRECRNLVYIEMGSNVMSVGARAFYNCTNITTTNITDISSWCNIDFEDTLSNPLYYSGDLFLNNKLVTGVIIPEGVREIKPGVFYNCSSLTSVTIPKSVTNIGASAFNKCTGLKTVIIPKNATTLYKSSFPTNTILCVYENSYSHTFVVENNMLYFVIRENGNPEISYGKSIDGTVTYTNGTAVADATVEILYDDGTVKETVTTDETGAYSFTYAEVGRYTIRVSDEKGYGTREVVSVKRMNAFDVYVSGETDLILKKTYSVYGKFTPVVATITLSDQKGNVVKKLDSTDGQYRIDNVPVGYYNLNFEWENSSVTYSFYVSYTDVYIEHNDFILASSTITGEVYVENRDSSITPKIWASVDLYDEEGAIIAHTTTDENGKYTFEKIPVGSYNIVATTTEIRPDVIGGFDKNHELKGYGHIDVTEFITYTVDTIILREDKVNLTSVSGKVTANGTTQDCEVILTNENGDQIAVFVTDNNGKYNFVNIPDGMYCITAITKVDGMGFAVITIENGVVHGDTDIKVAKADKISKREPVLLEDIPDFDTKEKALMYKEAILAEKLFYDSLSEKERKQLSEEWIKKLFKLVDLISDSSIVVTDGVKVENEESIISSDEIDETINFTLTVTETTTSDVDEDGINTDKEYETEKIKDKKGKNKNIAKYYDITFSKNGKNISNIQKQTETNGKLRITMEIPEEYRGHKHYSFVHMHKGEAVTLVDLDDDPNTVTFEIDKFSTFALTYSDVELVGEVEETIYPASITYNAETGKISVSSTETGTLYIATYNGNSLSNVVRYDVVANASANDYEFNSNQAAFVWNENLKPMCEKFVIGN